MTTDTALRWTRPFFTLWLGQLVSVVGSGLTTFALGVKVYNDTGSATQYALIALFGTLPSIVLGPLVGPLVDRWNRRATLLGCDLVAAGASIALIVLSRTGHLTPVPIYIAVGVSASAVAVRYPAYTAVVTILVPKGQLGRAAGLVQTHDAVAQLVCPLIAGALVKHFGIDPILIVDAASFAVSLAAIVATRIPHVPSTSRGAFLADLKFGMSYLLARSGLFALLIYFAVCNLLDGIIIVLASPMILSLASPEGLGFVLTLAGVGMLAGTMLVSAWGGPRRRIGTILWAEVGCGVAWMLAAIPQTIPPIAAAAFALFFLNAIVNSLTLAVWQTKVPVEVQGRISATRRMVVLCTQPLAFLIAGPLADHFAEPLLAPGGALASTVGRLVGVGKGRGIAFLFLLVGAGTILVTLVAMLTRRIRHLEDDIPDARP